MSKQSENRIPDYSIFYREINETSSPIHQSIEQLKQQQRDDLSNSNKDPNGFHPAQLLKTSASTDEDVDEFTMESPEDLDASPTTIQTYRDRLNARLNLPETTQITSNEYSQLTHDSGVEVISEQKISSRPADEQIQSEGTLNVNDHFNVSDDSLLDIVTRTHSTMHEQSISFHDESDENRSYATAINDEPILTKRDERGPTNNSDVYYSAESEFNTSLSFPTGDLVDTNEPEEEGDEVEEHHHHHHSSEEPTQYSPPVHIQLPSFSDWIDRVFTDFLADPKQESSIPSSRSSSLTSFQSSSQQTIDSSSSQVLTVIERTTSDICSNDNDQGKMMRTKQMDHRIKIDSIF